MDNLPPPPYSKHDTDSYSTSHSALPRPILTPNTSNLDTCSVPERPVSENDAASSIGDPIYTPPYTPDSTNDSFHHGHITLGHDLDTPTSPARAIAAAAAIYFESRPVRALSADTLLIHSILVSRDTQSTDLPFPKPEENWLERDVLPQDWQTFVNYLIPCHTVASNTGTADRKLKAEFIDERMNRLTLGLEDTSRTNLNAVNAQLEPLRQPHVDQEIATNINSITRIWNEGFFGPRGLHVEISAPDFDELIRERPGLWAENPAESKNSFNEAPRGRFRRGFGGGLIRADSSGFHIGKNFLSADKNGFRMGKGGIIANSNGFRVGNILVADGQGFKLGPIKADNYGFRIGGPDQPHHIRRDHQRGNHPEHYHVQIPHENRDRRHFVSTSETTRQRHRSRSTSSSSSSNSSASFQSIGSLPDYDHLDYGQLPIARNAVREWLCHPEQTITKETVSKIREELQTARGEKRNGSEEDQKILRQEVRELFREFKALKREQRHQWKAAKRERRAARRSAKRTRKAAKHQARDAAKQAHRQHKREIRDGKRRECHSSISPVPVVPAVPVMNTLPGTLPQNNTFVRETIKNKRGWPFIGRFQSPDVTRASELQRKGVRIEREVELGNSARAREESLARAAYARGQAPLSWGKGLDNAAVAQEQAQAHAASTRQNAETQSAHSHQVAKALTLKRAAATRISADGERMQADVDRMRTQAEKYNGDDKARLRLITVAERLQEEAEKLRREGERLLAEARHLEEGPKQDFQTEVISDQGSYTVRHKDTMTGQESVVIHDQLDAWIKAENEKHWYNLDNEGSV